MRRRKRGQLIVIDGGDFSGKKTQAEMLKEALEAIGKKVLLLSFPRYEDTISGRILKRAKEGEFGDFANYDPRTASTLYAGDRFESKQLIEEALAAGTYVICDRYASANQIHQGGKISDEGEREKFIQRLDHMEFVDYGIPRPDVSIYLDVPPEVSVALMKSQTKRKTDVLEVNEDYLNNSYKSAQWLMRTRPSAWVHIHCVKDGQMREKADIHMEILFILDSRFNLAASSPRG